MAQQTGRRKVFTGTVVSDKMHKTRVVQVQWMAKHAMYVKPVRKATKLKAHDEKNASKTGNKVVIMETRPLSKEKRWVIKEILKQQSAI